jgi:hypothetical protein
MGLFTGSGNTHATGVRARARYIHVDPRREGLQSQSRKDVGFQRKGPRPGAASRYGRLLGEGT